MRTRAIGLSAVVSVFWLGSLVSVEMPAGSEYTNSIGMEFVPISPGAFTMGFEQMLLSDELAKQPHLRDGDPDEQPPIR